MKRWNVCRVWRNVNKYGKVKKVWKVKKYENDVWEGDYEKVDTNKIWNVCLLYSMTRWNYENLKWVWKGRGVMNR